MRRQTRKTWRRWISGLLLGWALATGPGIAAADALEIIPLRHRPADELAPLLRPFLGPDDTLVAHRHQLLIRGTPESLAAIRALVKQLDVPLAQFFITVVQGRDLSDQELEARAAARVDIPLQDPADTDFSLRGHYRQSRSKSHDNQTQYLQTLEGNPAYIRFGEDRPLPDYDPYGYGAGIRYREISSGFEVIPRRAGDQVILEIAPWSERPGRLEGGSVELHSARTTVRAQLGEWVNLGGQIEERRSAGSGPFSTFRDSRSGSWNLYLKVETAAGR